MRIVEVSRPVTPFKVGAVTGPTERCVPEEEPVAIVCNGTTVAVMMATPADLEDFAVGFVLSERIVSHRDEIRSLEIVIHDAGIEARLWIVEERARAMIGRRRVMAGPTGCGLCGIESLEQVDRILPAVTHKIGLSSADIACALARLREMQTLNRATRAAHAAALWQKESGVVMVREDVGRHNALDKLIGAMARQETGTGALLLTSRVSIELVQKAAFANLPVIIAISVPTLAAIRNASRAEITLIAIARDDGFEIFTRPERIRCGFGS